MEDLSERVPLINRNVLKYLDKKSMVNFKETSRKVNQALKNERFYWIRFLNQHNGSFKEFQDAWNLVISQTHAQNVKQLALAAKHFFEENQERKGKEWHRGWMYST